MGSPTTPLSSRTMTFQKKLMVAFSIMIVPLVVIGVLTLWTIREENLALKTLETSLSRVKIFADLESMIYRQIRKIRDYTTGFEREAKEQFEHLNGLIQERMEAWRQAVVDPEDLRLAQALEHLHGEIVALATRTFDLYERNEREEALRLTKEELNGRLLPALDGIIKEIFRTSRAHNVQRAFKRVEVIERSTRTVLILIVLSSILFGVLFSFLISRSLARPVKELKRAMDIVGEGHLDHSIEVRSRDEIGELAESFIKMTEKLKKTQEEMVHLNADLQQKIQTLKETQAQLIHSEKLASLGQMSAAVAHGLRNPLASIRAATQLSLHRLPKKSPLGEHLRAVIGEVDRLEKRISHLLDFTKPVPFYPLLERVEPLVEGVRTIFTEKMAQQGIRLKADVRPDLPRVWVDPSQIEQALLEVISNALEAMPKGGTLRLSLGMEPEDEREVVSIEVTDDGEGIPEEALPRVFEPFFTTKADGTGLGLAIAKRFVEQNKGTMTVTSNPGEGTSVRIALPVHAS